MRDPASSDGIIRFGKFELDAETGELRKQGRKVNLSGQPIEVLRLLLDRPGELVTRERLREQLWPRDTVVEFEHSINAAIRRLRESLGDNADRPRFIETLPRRGYRFIAPMAVEERVHEAPAAQQEIRQGPESSHLPNDLNPQAAPWPAPSAAVRAT